MDPLASYLPHHLVERARFGCWDDVLQLLHAHPSSPSLHKMLRHQDHGGTGFAMLHHCFAGRGPRSPVSPAALLAAESAMCISDEHGLHLASLMTGDTFILPLTLASTCAPPRVIALLVRSFPSALVTRDPQKFLPMERAKKACGETSREQGNALALYLKKLTEANLKNDTRAFDSLVWQGLNSRVYEELEAAKATVAKLTVANAQLQALAASSMESAASTSKLVEAKATIAKLVGKLERAKDHSSPELSEALQNNARLQMEISSLRSTNSTLQSLLKYVHAQSEGSRARRPAANCLLRSPGATRT
jgi:hypothetical protein